MLGILFYKLVKKSFIGVSHTLMVESEAELKSLLMKVKEENEKAGLKFNNQKN